MRGRVLTFAFLLTVVTSSRTSPQLTITNGDLDFLTRSLGRNMKANYRSSSDAKPIRRFLLVGGGSSIWRIVSKTTLN